jgi:phosphatidate cytidylyltransferase
MSASPSNLALRVGSAIVLFPLLVWATWAGGLALSVLLAIAAGVAALELISFYTAIGFPEVVGAIVAALLPLEPWWAGQGGRLCLPSVTTLLAVAAMVLLALNLFRPGPLDAAPRRVAGAALSWLYCGALIAIFSALRLQYGFAWVIVAFVATWGNDTLAYFAGRFLGKHLLLPKVSPKKTWEGFAGGVAGSVLGVLGTKAVFLAIPLPAGESFALGWWGCVGLGLGASVLGPLGDLVESMLKRAAGVKDSGHLIPGHGGLLDRIDALLFVGPWVYLWALLVS